MKKITLLFSVLLASFTLLGQSTTTSMYLYTQGVTTGIKVTTTSDNNRYYVGSFDGSSLLYDFQTGLLTQFVMDISSEFVILNDVDNNGVAIGGYGYTLGDMKPATYINGQFSFLSLGTHNVLFGSANGVSADGSVIIGYISDEGFNYLPTVWINGELGILPSPTIDIFGLPISGAVADRINADGSIITGRLYNNRGEENGLVWRYNEQIQAYEYEYFGLGLTYDFSYSPDSANFTNGHFLDLSSTCLSPNGRYLIATDVNGSFFNGTANPVVFDFENNNDSIIYNGFAAAMGIGVSNTGLVTVATPLIPQANRNSYVFTPGNNDTPIYFIDYLETTYGFNSWPTFIPTTGTINVSGDGEHFFGYTISDDSFIGNINLYITPTPAASIPELVAKNAPIITNTLITDNILLINREVSLVRIFDVSGRVVLQTTHQNTINISALSNGMYLIETTEFNNETATTRVVKK